MPDPPGTPDPAPPEPPLVCAGVAAILRPADVTPDPGGCTASDRWSILLTRRRHDTVYAGYWELPGGKVENDETPEQAAVREVREEIGCEVEVTALLDPIEYDYDHARVRLFTGVCRLATGSPEPRNLEVAEHAWVRLSELPWEGFLPGNVRLVTALCRYLDRQGWP